MTREPGGSRQEVGTALALRRALPAQRAAPAALPAPQATSRHIHCFPAPQLGTHRPGSLGASSHHRARSRRAQTCLQSLFPGTAARLSLPSGQPPATLHHPNPAGPLQLKPSQSSLPVPEPCGAPRAAAAWQMGQTRLWHRQLRLQPWQCQGHGGQAEGARRRAPGRMPQQTGELPLPAAQPGTFM